MAQDPIYPHFVLFRLRNRKLPASQPRSLDCAFLGRQGLRGGTAVWIPQSRQQRSVREGLCVCTLHEGAATRFPIVRTRPGAAGAILPPASSRNLRGLFGPFSLQARAGLEGGLGDGMPVSTPRPSTAQTQTGRKPAKDFRNRPSRPLTRRALWRACVICVDSDSHL